MNRLTVLAALLLIAGCSTPGPTPTPLKDLTGSPAQVEGWVNALGGLAVYATRDDASNHTEETPCQPIVLSTLLRRQGLHLDGRKVSISGTSYAYSDLPLEDRPVLQRRVLNGTIVSNFCRADRIILADRVRILE